MSWGNRIAQAREAAGLTQIQLAERLNAAQQTVASWEVEENEPRLAVFEAIAKITGTTPEWLAFEVGPGPSIKSGNSKRGRRRKTPPV